MKLYRIYTEDKNRERIEEEVSKYFEGFTIYEAIGYWKMIKENSLVIEIITKNVVESGLEIKVICGFIKALNSQESILLTMQDMEMRFI